MTIIEQYTDMAGKLRITTQLSNGVILSLKFASQPTQQQLDAIETNYNIIHTDDDTLTMFSNTEDKESILLITKKLFNNPALTINQFNAWMATLTWDIQTVIWYFLLRLKQWLQLYHEVVFDDGTQIETMRKCRNWISGHQQTKVSKLIFGDRNITLTE